MTRRDIGTDDHRVRVRPGKRSRPRTKLRPDYSQCPRALVVGIDRGRYRLDYQGIELTAVKARELGRGSVVVGDWVAVTGDLSGRKDTLARIVQIAPRSTVLRRCSEELNSGAAEKTIVANARFLVIVTAMADPAPRPGFIDRCLVAAFDAGMEPILCLTKADLGDPRDVQSLAHSLGVRTVVVSHHLNHPAHRGVEELRALISGEVSVLIGHSGVGKSTLINALVPHAQRSTGQVNSVTGRGRHTSTNVVALRLAPSGLIIDTPGVRTFGLAHVSADSVIAAFPDLAEAASVCPRGCTHLDGETECGLDRWWRDTCEGSPLRVGEVAPIGPGGGLVASSRSLRRERVASVRRLLTSLRATEDKPWLWAK